MKDIYIQDMNKLSVLFQDIRKLIEDGFYDQAVTDMRKIAHYMAKWLVYDEGIWDEARVGKAGVIRDEPSLERCINILRKHRKIDTDTRHMFDIIRTDGNFGAHDVGTTKSDAESNYKILFSYYIHFMTRFPNADRLSLQPFGNKSRSKKPESEDDKLREIFYREVFGDGYN